MIRLITSTCCCDSAAGVRPNLKMIVGDRIRAIRERKQLSQVELAVRAGLVRSHISNIENGYVVPSIEALEKIARVLEVPLHQLFYDGDELPPLPNLPNRVTAADIVTGMGRNFRHD